MKLRKPQWISECAGWRISAILLCLSLSIVPNHAFAQHGETVEYYISPYPHAVEIDPLGAALGRIGARYEYRVDPLLTRYFEIVYQPQLNKAGNGIVTTSKSIAIGERIYLRDNSAMMGLFAGVNLGAALINSSGFSARISLEIGYKVVFEKSSFFLEPEMIIDSYFLRRANMSEVYPYVALPFGYMW